MGQNVLLIWGFLAGCAYSTLSDSESSCSADTGLISVNGMVYFAVKYDHIDIPFMVTI